MRFLVAKMTVFLAPVFCLGILTASAEDLMVIKAERLLDGTGAPAIENAVVIVKGERIEAVGSALTVAIPEDTHVIDLSHDTVMPGKIDGHFHSTIRAFDTGLEGELDEMAQPVGQQTTLLTQSPFG